MFPHTIETDVSSYNRNIWFWAMTRTIVYPSRLADSFAWLSFRLLCTTYVQINWFLRTFIPQLILIMTFRMYGTDPHAKSVVPGYGLHPKEYVEVFPILSGNLSVNSKNYSQHIFLCACFVINIDLSFDRIAQLRLVLYAAVKLGGDVH